MPRAYALLLAFLAVAARPLAAADWRFAVSGDSRDCGDVVMPAIAEKALALGPQFYWHLGDFRRIYGIDADVRKDAQLFSEYRARDAFSGRDAEASIGLRNRWPIAAGVLANTSFERVSPLAGATTGHVFAATAALELTG